MQKTFEGLALVSGLMGAAIVNIALALGVVGGARENRSASDISKNMFFSGIFVLAVSMFMFLVL